MKQYKIKITELTEKDLERAGDYIAYELKNPTAAVNTVRGIRKQINSLTNFRREMNQMKMRCLPKQVSEKITIKIIKFIM